MVLSTHICRRHSGSIRAIQRENNRTIDDRNDFPLSDINWDKTPENVFLIRSDGWLASIKSELSDHGIDGYRKNAVLLFDVIYSASADFFEKNEPETITAFFNDCLRFHDSEFGHVINAVVHCDETTPHLHVVSVPIVERENGFALCARELIPGKQKLFAFHDRLFQEVGCRYDLERGQRSDSLSKKKHLDMYRFKLHCLEEKIAVAINDLERLNTDIERAGSVKELFEWALVISEKIETVIVSLGGCTINGIQEAIETRGILLERKITEAGCHIQIIDNNHCCISDASDKPLSWNGQIPLYIQDGMRLLPSWQVLDGDQLQPWFIDNISSDTRDPVEARPLDTLNQIADELDSLIDHIDLENDNIEQDNDDVDRWNDNSD